jgi:hypothetical protein
MKHVNLYYLLLLFFIFSSCKKSAISSDDWEELASRKLTAIEGLIASKNATNKDEWYIKEVQNYWCGTSYFAMHKSLEQDFDKLWQQYRELVKNKFNAGVKEGIIYEPCEEFNWYDYSPIRLEIENQQAKLIFAEDLTAAQCRELLPDLQQSIEKYQDQLTCTGTEQWQITALVGGCYNTYLPYLATNDYSEIKKIVGRYNAISTRLFSLEHVPCTQGPRPSFKSVTCENGRPKVNYNWN